MSALNRPRSLSITIRSRSRDPLTCFRPSSVHPRLSQLSRGGGAGRTGGGWVVGGRGGGAGRTGGGVGCGVGGSGYVGGGVGCVGGGVVCVGGGVVCAGAGELGTGWLCTGTTHEERVNASPMPRVILVRLCKWWVVFIGSPKSIERGSGEE